MQPDFMVKAEYFYALTAHLSPEIPAEQRYKIVTLTREEELVRQIQTAIDTNIIADNLSPNIYQAARRLHALGDVTAADVEYIVVNNTSVDLLVEAWLGIVGESTEAFWNTIETTHGVGHLELVLVALTENHTALITAIKTASQVSANPLDDFAPITIVSELVNRKDRQWRSFFKGRENLLPDFTKPGTNEERIEAFIRHLRKFFAVGTVGADAPEVGTQTVAGLPKSNIFEDFAARYLSLSGSAFDFASSWNEAHFRAALMAVFPLDNDARAWLEQALHTIAALYQIADVGVVAVPNKPDLRTSIMEALYARGFTSKTEVTQLTFAEFLHALIGTIAYPYAAMIYSNAGGSISETEEPSTSAFRPINPDDRLTNCIPAPHVSPLGPFAYLRDLLAVTSAITCAEPFEFSDESDDQERIANLLESRCGNIYELHVTPSNLNVPLPMIDIVNENLEFLAANLPNTKGIILDTASDKVDIHLLRAVDAPEQNSEPYHHDPVTLLEALPEHSSPATPVHSAAAYDLLEADFSAPELPYSQSRDVAQKYLNHIGTTRYKVMRRFRKDIRAFVLDPDNEPSDFDRHLWRYPVRCEIAIEYLGITPQEHRMLFSQEIATTNTEGQLSLHNLYGFQEEQVGRAHWTEVVLQLSEFLKRTGLQYCSFIDLWQSDFVKFSRLTVDGHSTDDEPSETDNGFPQCEPCCPGDYYIRLETESDDIDDILTALKKLIVFIRLWQKLQRTDPLNYHFDELGTKPYTFTQLHDICEVFGLFQDDDTINPDFICQLAAFQMLRDHFALQLNNGNPVEDDDTGAKRTHLLALWDSSSNAHEWAVQHLIDQIQYYAQKRLAANEREPEFLKLLQENLDRLSKLVGFNPSKPEHQWNANPRHTLRFAEVLAKIYASDFSIGEILFLFTAEKHLEGDDVFELPSDEEIVDTPFEFPDDEADYDILALRKKLLDVNVDEQRVAEWSWLRIERALIEDFGYEIATTGVDPLRSFGEHFFPSIVRSNGSTVTLQAQQYRASLPVTATQMWNTAPYGPFRYDAGTKELYSQLPLTDEAVIQKLSRIRQLDVSEQEAVKELYFSPRMELAQFAFIFDNFGEAQVKLIQEADEEKRWQYFQKSFAKFYARCGLIAEHLTAHVIAETGQSSKYEGYRLAWILLRHLYADENRAMSNWEDNNGTMPTVLWDGKPRGGAFNALLGLTGTGLLGEFRTLDGELLWRELRGATDAFSHVLNAYNAPVPTIIPQMTSTLATGQDDYVGIHNGYIFDVTDGTQLGGVQGFRATWRGTLLVDEAGKYQFFAGAPTDEGLEPDFGGAKEHSRWRISLKRGQKTWVLLNHQWVGENAPADRSTSLSLEDGAYKITIEFERPTTVFSDTVDICPQMTGLQLKYVGPDTCGNTITIPQSRLFYEFKDSPLSAGIDGLNSVKAKGFLTAQYTSTIRDIRRTYQRAFKALLLAHRFNLSPEKRADSGQSEIEYMLENTQKFAGVSYYKPNVNFKLHRADLNFNFLPVDDIYFSPGGAPDERRDPSPKRQQALFDWWERLFDYVDMRTHTRTAPGRPVWLLFHEAKETHKDNPSHLLRHMGVDYRHADAVLTYYDSYQVTSNDLVDERWAVRVWRAEMWVDDILKSFYAQDEDIRPARPDLWAGQTPSVGESGETFSANTNLTRFVRLGCIENDDLRRYSDIKQLTDVLRLNARDALVAYLTGMNRVALPSGGFAKSAQDLSDLLLMDIQVELCQKASRVGHLLSTIQEFVQRARLGLEVDFVVNPEFGQAWDRHYASFHIWENCKRRMIYRENWIEWDELDKARRTEAFRFLEDQLRRSTITIAAPGGLEHWNNPQLPPHPSLLLLQQRDLSVIARLKQPVEVPTQPPTENHNGTRYDFGVSDTPDRDSRPVWLAPLIELSVEIPEQPENPEEPDPNDDDVQPPVPLLLEASDTDNDDQPLLIHTLAVTRQPMVMMPEEMQALHPILPYWIEAAIRLGARFVRVAASGIPPASLGFQPHKNHQHASCCAECGKTHAPVMDEYYFWLVDGRYYDAVRQHAVIEGRDWHNVEDLPALLHWENKKLVYLIWCRVHNGEFQPPRWSSQGVRVTSNTDLNFLGRLDDSLYFAVTGGFAPPGYDAFPATDTGDDVDEGDDDDEIETVMFNPGFRYDLATDNAVVLPEIAAQEPAPIYAGGLMAYPFFVHFPPGSTLLPLSNFSPVIAIATALRANCRYEAALKWYESAFNPLRQDLAALWCGMSQLPSRPDSVPDTSTEPVFLMDDVSASVRFIRYESYCCNPTENITNASARNRTIALHYLETLLEWGDAMMRRNTPESFQQARVIYDTTSRLLGNTPRTVVGNGHTSTAELPRLWDFEPETTILNPRLLSLYQETSDRQDMIHACLTAKRLKNGKANIDMPYFGNTPLRAGWQNPAQVCVDDNDWCAPVSPYRFQFLIQKAQQFAGEVRSLGAALLAAYEKGDAEYLAALRAAQETQMLKLGLSIRQNQWRDADWQVQALQKSKEHAQERLRYYENLIQHGLISEEHQYGNLTTVSVATRAAGNIVEAIGQILHLIPDLYVGFPVTQTHIPIGSKLSWLFSAAARVAFTVADITSTEASRSLTEGGWERRLQEWLHQTTILPIEIEQIERQILGAERRRDVALQELNNHQRQIENTQQVQNFLRDKFTNHALYLWNQKELAALHEQMYHLARHTAHQAQRAYNYERGQLAEVFVDEAGAWDTLHEGLLSGERLQVDLHRMEKCYLDNNYREYELTKHISLRQHFPWAFLYLKATGYCEIELPEWLFDLDYPGHYLRRIKNVTLTLPNVAGPYTGVHCRLTLLSGDTRMNPRLRDPNVECCDTLDEDNGYPAITDDPRIVKDYIATEAISTSSGQNDSGMFEVNFRDERYLPFEYRGVANSRWRIELPHENNYFDMDTLSDVILRVNYTAREGGEILRDAARSSTRHGLPDNGWRLFDVKYDLANEWHRFQNQIAANQDEAGIGIHLKRNMFPYLPVNNQLLVKRMIILFETATAIPSQHTTLEFMVGQLHGKQHDCEIREVRCVATKEWPNLFVGEIELDESTVGIGRDVVIGSIMFPCESKNTEQIWLLCQYSLAGGKV